MEKERFSKEKFHVVTDDEVRAQAQKEEKKQSRRAFFRTMAAAVAAEASVVGLVQHYNLRSDIVSDAYMHWYDANGAAFPKKEATQSSTSVEITPTPTPITKSRQK